MDRSEPTMRGGCQCGAVRYAARPESLEAYYCHCRMCQKAFGNLFGVFFKARRGEVSWQGEPAYFDSSKVARRGFCRTCGTPLTFERPDSEWVHFSVGSADEPGLLRPVAHYGFEGVVEPFFVDDGLPKSRTEDSAEFVRKWKAAHGPDSEPGPLVR
jgi:hypothetical protein